MKYKILKVKTKKDPYYLMMKEAMAASLRPRLFFFMEIFPSLECNVNCPRCDRGREKSILKDFNDIKILYDNLRLDPDCHLTHFRISGKEPTLYPRINGLISFLHRLNPKVAIYFYTNAIELRRLTDKSLSQTKLVVSIYRDTKNILRKSKYIKDILKSKGIPLKVNIFDHEDLKSFGSYKSDFDPLLGCFSAVLLCGTKKVYPCCRAHLFEQMYKKKYHLRIHTQNLYQGLKGLIKNTDLCTRCPRIYRNPVLADR